ncbi:MAG: DUF3179 domain-containing (seleno)protein [Gammaproteobacteria bacterium]
MKKSLFWLLIGVSLVLNFIIFKDLADISQWLVQSSREFTMAVWFNRHIIAAVSLGALVAAWIIWAGAREICRTGVVIGLTALSLFLFYSGYINPHVMFRSQQHTAQFVPAGEARPYFEQAFEYARFGWEEYPSVDDISVMVLETDQGAIAYSDYFILQPHVATGGTIDGEEVIMTYCGLTNLGIAYSPVIDGQPLELSVMTQLENNLVLWDHNTGQPIQQIWGTMERAEERGRMKEWPTVRMPFSSFEQLYPDGRVYVNNIDGFTDNPLTAAFDRLTRHVMMYNGVSLQWVGDDPAFPTIDEFDERLPRKTLIYGLNVADDYVAYTKEFVADRGNLINTRIGGRDVVISYDEQFDAVGAFYNDTGAPVAEIDVHGMTPDGAELARIETLKNAAFWFIWANFHGDTDVNRA